MQVKSLNEDIRSANEKMAKQNRVFADKIEYVKKLRRVTCAGSAGFRQRPFRHLPTRPTFAALGSPIPDATLIFPFDISTQGETCFYYRAPR